MKQTLVTLAAAFLLTACAGGSLLTAFDTTPTVNHNPSTVTCATMKLIHWRPVDHPYTVHAIKLANAELRRQCPGIKEYWPDPVPEGLPPPRLTQPSS